MAKTSYKQTIKGNKATAATHQRQAKLYGRLAYARRVGMKNIKKQYDSSLSRIEATRRSTVADLISGQKTAIAGYDRSEKDAENNLGEVTSSSRLNRAREGSSAMAELSSLQAGETDRIKGMAASIRNMKVNMDSGAGDYASALTSINNALGDLNASTSTNINNALREEDSNKASAYGEYLTGRQQAYSDLVDLYGQQGSAQEQAADALATKKSTTKSKGTKHVTTTQTDRTVYGKRGNKLIKSAQTAFDNAGDAADQLAKLQGEPYTGRALTIDQMNAGISDPNQRYQAAEMRQNQSNLDDLENAGTLRKLAEPQGSKLRKMAV